jgi:hypothetical protein
LWEDRRNWRLCPVTQIEWKLEIMLEEEDTVSNFQHCSLNRLDKCTLYVEKSYSLVNIIKNKNIYSTNYSCFRIAYISALHVSWYTSSSYQLLYKNHRMPFALFTTFWLKSF